MSNADMILLAESRQVEGESDLYAMAGDFGTASRLMREANELRARVFGKADPNQLREMTIVALGNPLPLTAQREGELRNLTANTVIDREKDQVTSDVLARASQIGGSMTNLRDKVASVLREAAEAQNNSVTELDGGLILLDGEFDLSEIADAILALPEIADALKLKAGIKDAMDGGQQHVQQHRPGFWSDLQKPDPPTA